jgi:Ca2+-binding EF-hand superfamily protein
MFRLIPCLVLAAAAAAQATPTVAGGGPRASAQAPPPAARPAAPERTVLHDYSEPQSRALFTACDEDGDDRLDVFETRAALADLGDTDKPAWFRRHDSDRDGFLDWPEFDRFYGDLVRGGGTLTVRLAQPLPTAPKPVTPAAAAAPNATDLFDTNRDGVLDQREAESMLRELNVPPSLVAMLRLLDVDRDGRYTEAELAPALQNLNLGPFAKGTPAKPATPAPPLPPAWAALDRDRTQTIDLRELSAALRRVDPQLDRWAGKVHAGSDKNNDGQLRVNELPAEEARPEAMVDGPRKR